MSAELKPKVFIGTCGAWYLRHTAKAFEAREALAALWCTEKNVTAVDPSRFRRSWPFHLAMYPFYRLRSAALIEHAFYWCFPFWKSWFKGQPAPDFNVAHAITGYATEFFDLADRFGALKVADCPNSHPITSLGYWQRECDLWCPGETVPVPRWLFARMNRELEHADLVLCPSTFVRDTMVQNGVPGEKCFVNPFGVDTGVFKPRGNPPVKPRFVCVGTICVRKGHQYLFRAFEKVKQRMPEAELVCVGDYKSDFRKERSQWEGRFTHHRNLSHPELAKLLQTCTAFVITSVEEGFARVIAEAMGAGLPIIGTHESGATTVVRDGVEGMIVPSRNIEKTAEAMLRLAADPGLANSMGQAAYQRGAVKNTWQDYGDRLLVEYERRLAAR